MRLKHVFTLAPLLLFAAIAGAADTQLKQITVTAQGGATVVAIETAGPFTHSEYRPQPSMVMVDLPKVSSTTIMQRQRSLDSPAVKSYRVLEYKSVGGVVVTRLEFSVTDAAKFQAKETKNGLQLWFATGGSIDRSQASAATAVSASAAHAVPKPAASAPAKPVSHTEAASSQPVTIRNIGVVRTSAGVAVEIEGAKTARTLRLADPERLVVDVQNSLSATKQRTIVVNGPDLKSVRIAQFQLDPPVMRVVLDLTGPRDFDVANQGSKLVVTVLPPGPGSAASSTTTAPNPDAKESATLAQTPKAVAALATDTSSATPAFADLTQGASLMSTTAALHPVGSAFVDQGLPAVAEQASAPPASQAETVPAQTPMDEVPPTQTTAQASAPQAVAAVQNSASREDHARLVPVTLTSAKEQPSGELKSANYVVATPEFKKQDTAPVTAPVAANPSDVRTVEPTATVAQVHPPEPVAQVVATPELKKQDTAPDTTPVAANPTDLRTAEPTATVAQVHPPEPVAQVVATPELKKQDTAPAPAPVAANPANTRAIEAAATVAQVHPPEPIAQVQPQQPLTPRPAANLALEQQKAIANPEPPPAPKKYTGEPISVNLKDVDLKDFFRLIHEISGLNIVLDPNVRGTLTLVLDDVPWDQALDVVLRNNGLGRELEGNILRIAALDTFRKEAEEQRARTDAQALAVSKITVTRFLSYGRAKEIMPTIKKLLTVRGEVLADDRTNALIISDIPSVIPGLDRLIAQLDRKTLQVEIEARVVAATRNFAQQLGTQVGFAWGNGATAIGGNPSTGNSPNSYTSTGFPYFSIPGPVVGGGTPVAQTIPLFSNLPAVGSTSGLNFATAIGNYRLDVLLSAAESRGLLKVLSRPRVVTQNNVTAVVRQGVRVPIVTQGQLGGPATTSYIDAFLRLTVTPQITVENTIFLAVDVENTTPDFGNTGTMVGGNPSLITQQATTQVLVSDGGTVVIGGVIQTQSSINVQQVPWLGNIPVLGNLFKSRSVTTSTQELIFFLSPKIVHT